MKPDRTHNPNLGIAAINSSFASTRPRPASAIERRKLAEERRNTEERLRQLELAEREHR